MITDKELEDIRFMELTDQFGEELYSDKFSLEHDVDYCSECGTETLNTNGFCSRRCEKNARYDVVDMRGNLYA